MQGLLLVGHGSAHGPETAAPVYQHARQIEATGRFDEVQVAFYKQDPPLSGALGRFRAGRVVVVPMFLADGYYTRHVIPRELRLNQTGTRDVRYANPIGAHPRMAELILLRARGSAPLAAVQRRRAALIVVGHGTERSRTSRTTVEHAVRRVREQSDFGWVDCGFLDEEPRIEAVVAASVADTIVIVPFFLASGWHTEHTIPEQLGLTGPHTQRDGRSYWYTPPIGTLPHIADVIIDLARSASNETRVH